MYQDTNRRGVGGDGGATAAEDRIDTTDALTRACDPQQHTEPPPRVVLLRHPSQGVLLVGSHLAAAHGAARWQTTPLQCCGRSQERLSHQQVELVRRKANPCRVPPRELLLLLTVLCVCACAGAPARAYGVAAEVSTRYNFVQ